MHGAGRVNPLVTSVHHIQPSQSDCSAFQLTGFFVMRSLIVNGLRTLAGKKHIQKNSNIREKYEYKFQVYL